jgi:P-type E1-E2 ATPase
MADALRDGAAAALSGLRGAGIERILRAIGDWRAVADVVADALGLDAVRAEWTPARKVLWVLSERENQRVMMVGDAVNDAPALAAVGIGAAMGAHAAAASAKAADVVFCRSTGRTGFWRASRSPVASAATRDRRDRAVGCGDDRGGVRSSDAR